MQVGQAYSNEIGMEVMNKVCDFCEGSKGLTVQATGFLDVTGKRTYLCERCCDEVEQMFSK